MNAGCGEVCAYRLSRLAPLVERDREQLAEIRRLERELGRLLDEHGTTLRDESGIGAIAAATLVVEVGDPFRFASESKFARWCGTGAVALSTGEGRGIPVRHRLDFGGDRRITASSASPASSSNASTPTHAPTANARSPKASPEAARAEHTNGTSPTATSELNAGVRRSLVKRRC